MIFLLDVNVLIALGDANHPHRLAALRFLESSATVDKTLRAFASPREIPDPCFLDCGGWTPNGKYPTNG
jgi:hypothetical protein